MVLRRVKRAPGGRAQPASCIAPLHIKLQLLRQLEVPTERNMWELVKKTYLAMRQIADSHMQFEKERVEA